MVKRWLYLVICTGLCVLAAGLLWRHSQNKPILLSRNAKRFRLSETCLKLDTHARSIPVPEGVLWYHALTYPFLTKPGQPGLLWRRSDQEGRFPLSDRLIAQTDTSPDKRAFLLADLESGYLYRVNWPQPEVVLTQAYIGNYPVWQTNDIVQGTDSDWETQTVQIIRTNLKAKKQSRIAFHVPDLTQAPVMSTDGWVIYRALWLPEYPASRLFSSWPTPPSPRSPMYAVIAHDYIQNHIYGYLEIAGYFGKLYTGYRIHPSGRYIVGIGAPSGTHERFSFRGTELYGAKIGQPMKQITNFHAYYEQVEILGLHLGAQFPWSPDGRWLWIRADIKASLGDETQNYGYLLDLEENVAYSTCQPLGHSAVEVRWSPSGQYMALGLKDKIWAVDLQTKETWLLVDRKGTPITLLGWTQP